MHFDTIDLLLEVVYRLLRGGGAVAQSVERVTPGEEAVGSIPTVTPAPY